MSQCSATSTTGDASSVVKLDVSHRGTTHSLLLSPSDTLAQLRQELFRLTDVPISKQKLFASRSKVAAAFKPGSLDAAPPTTSLAELGLSAGAPPLRIMLVGSSEHEVGEVQRHEAEASRRSAPRNYHPSLLRGAKPRSTGAATTSSLSPFLSLRPHASTPRGTPLYDRVVAYLTRLAEDAGVRHVCRLHDFRVGELTELLPHEHPNLLGLNENIGQRISLRLRTDDYEGLRDYKTTRRVLLHELAHNKVNDHPPEFKILNSELNAQLEAYERSVAAGTHSLLDYDDAYEPSTQLAANGRGALAGGSYVLGGGDGGKRGEGEAARGGGIGADLTPQQRRDKVLHATMQRLAKLEAEIEKGCGGSSSSSGGGGAP